MDKPLRQHIAELKRRVQQLSQDVMQNRNTLPERNGLEAELRVAQQALAHCEQAIKGGTVGQKTVIESKEALRLVQEIAANVQKCLETLAKRHQAKIKY